MEKILIVLLILETIVLAFVLFMFAKVIIDEIKPSIIYFINKRKRQKENNKKLIELQEQYYNVLCEIQKGFELGFEVDDKLIEDLYAQADALEFEVNRRKEL